VSVRGTDNVADEQGPLRREKTGHMRKGNQRQKIGPTGQRESRTEYARGGAGADRRGRLSERGRARTIARDWAKMGRTGLKWVFSFF
jgi:hypothetical protein